jgi:hypothetical protein
MCQVCSALFWLPIPSKIFPFQRTIWISSQASSISLCRITVLADGTRWTPCHVGSQPWRHLPLSGIHSLMVKNVIFLMGHLRTEVIFLETPTQVVTLGPSWLQEFLLCWY